MPGARRSHRSRRKKKTARWIILAILLCSAASCVAPVLYATTDCSRWLAEYKQGILQRRAARRLHFARYRLTAMIRRPAPVHPRPLQHRMSPLESLRRFQIDCGEITDIPTPTNPPVIPPLPLEPTLAFVDFGELPPDLPPPTPPEVALLPPVPPLINVPTTPVEQTLPPAVLGPSPTPEPGTFLLVLTGAAAVLGATRRKGRDNQALS